MTTTDEEYCEANGEVHGIEPGTEMSVAVGVHCELEKGHPGPHRFTEEWDDETEA